MNVRQLPTDDDVRQAMTLVLAEAHDAARKPTITAVERRLDITHPTFYRNFPDLITWFKQQTVGQPAPAAPNPDTEPNAATQFTNLRRENQDLRARVTIYAEALRQLTLDHTALRDKLNADARVIDLNAHQRRRTTDNTEDPS